MPCESHDLCNPDKPMMRGGLQHSWVRACRKERGGGGGGGGGGGTCCRRTTVSRSCEFCCAGSVASMVTWPAAIAFFRSSPAPHVHSHYTIVSFAISAAGQANWRVVQPPTRMGSYQASGQRGHQARESIRMEPIQAGGLGCHQSCWNRHTCCNHNAPDVINVSFLWTLCPATCLRPLVG